jgi:hypothetical protein
VVGPYDEVAFSVLVRLRQNSTRGFKHKCQTFACPISLSTNINYFTKTLKLFVSQENTLHYGREYLGIDKSIADTSIDRQKNEIGTVTASFRNTKGNSTFFSAKLHVKRDIVADLLLVPRLMMEGNLSGLWTTLLDILWGRIQTFGFVGSRGIHNNPIYEKIDPITITMTKLVDTSVNEWDPRQDLVEISDKYYGNLGFRPIVISDQRKFKMIFFEPYNGGNTYQ